MNKLNLNESNFKWLEDRTILLAKSGSFAYGTNTKQSDRDFKGVCLPPIEYYLGLQSFNSYDKSGGKNFKNTKDDVDVSVFHINKFVSDLMSGVPNSIELLFNRDEDYLKVTHLGERLIENRHLFLSKAVYRKFGGYAYSQIHKLKRSQVKEDELIGIRDYNTKMFMHGVRLLTSAIEILETHDYSTYRPNKELLLDCRNGKYSFKEAVEMLEHYDNELKISFEKSTLRKKPDYKQVNELLISINREGLAL